MSPPNAPFQTEAVPLSSIPASVPLVSIPAETNHEAVALRAVELLSNNSAECFSHDAQWRDILALTSNMRTFFGATNIIKTWTNLASLHQPASFQLNPGSSSIIRHGPVAWIEATLTFSIPARENHHGRSCSGILRIAPDDNGEYRIILLVTLLEQLDGCRNVDVMEKLSLQDSSKQQADNGPESGKDSFDCIVIGGGSSGLHTAGRLKALGISSVVLDRNAEIGGNWLSRYRSFSLHTSKTESEMPFGGVHSPEDPYFLTSAHMAAGYKKFIEWYGLSVWCSTTVKAAVWNKDTKNWTVDAEILSSGSCDKRTLHARHVVFAIGSGGQTPKIPEISNRDLYEGEVLHSAEYTTGEQWKGKRGAVVGSANSAQDIAVDMVNSGFSSVVMLQRSATEVLPLTTYKAIFDPIYHEGANLDIVDKLVLSIPLNITRVGALGGIRQLADSVPEYWAGLEQAGFAVNRYPDIISTLYERQGGHYFDVGGSKKIVSGEIKVEKGTIETFTKTGLQLQDGRALDADVIVLATGFEVNMRKAVLDILDTETAQRMEEYWRVDKEGELRGYAKPMIGQQNAW